jgi:hypothetical protein
MISCLCRNTTIINISGSDVGCKTKKRFQVFARSGTVLGGTPTIFRLVVLLFILKLYLLIFFLYIIKKFRWHETGLSVLHFAGRSDKISSLSSSMTIKYTVLWPVIIP